MSCLARSTHLMDSADDDDDEFANVRDGSSGMMCRCCRRCCCHRRRGGPLLARSRRSRGRRHRELCLGCAKSSAPAAAVARLAPAIFAVLVRLSHHCPSGDWEATLPLPLGGSVLAGAFVSAYEPPAFSCVLASPSAVSAIIGGGGGTRQICPAARDSRPPWLHLSSWASSSLSTSSSSSSLGAFWSRGSDADGSTAPADGSRGGANTFWRKLGRRDGTEDISSSSDARRSGSGRLRGASRASSSSSGSGSKSGSGTSAGTPTTTAAAASVAKRWVVGMRRNRDEGGGERGRNKGGGGGGGGAASSNGGRGGGARRGGALSVHTTPRDTSSERYIYSPVYLSELCPSFDLDAARRVGGVASTTSRTSANFVEECILDDDFYDRYSAMEAGRQAYDRHIAEKREKIKNFIDGKGDPEGATAAAAEAAEEKEERVVGVGDSDEERGGIGLRRLGLRETPTPFEGLFKSKGNHNRTKAMLSSSSHSSSSSPPPQSPWWSFSPGKGTWAGRIVESTLTDLVNRHALHTLNLRFDASSSYTPSSSSSSLSLSSASGAAAAAATAPRPSFSPQLLSLLLRGDVPSVTATFDRLSFPLLALSGGGALSAKFVALNSLSFVPGLGRFVRRFREPFELSAVGCVFTQEDVRNSLCIRDGLGTLLDRILKRVVAGAHEVFEVAVAGVEDFVRVDVTKVDIVDNSNMISCTGIITTKAGHPDVPFSVRTGLSCSHSGRVLRFPKMEMVFNPSSPLPVVLPLHILHPVDLDIGEDARIDEVVIDGRRGTLRVSMRAVVTPDRKSENGGTRQKTNYLSTAGEGAGTGTGTNGMLNRFSPAPKLWAKYSCDIGEWLTNIGRFSS